VSFHVQRQQNLSISSQILDDLLSVGSHFLASLFTEFAIDENSSFARSTYYIALTSLLGVSVAKARDFETAKFIFVFLSGTVVTLFAHLSVPVWSPYRCPQVSISDFHKGENFGLGESTTNFRIHKSETF